MTAQRAAALMTRPLGWRSAALLLAALAAVWQLAAPAELPGSVQPSVSAADEPAPAQPAAPPSSTYPAIAEHPLFYPTRQPWAPPAPKPAVPAPPPPSPPTAPHPLQKYQLVGVVISEGARTALLRSSAGGKTVAVAEGQDLDGWILREISRDRLHFESAGVFYDVKFPTPRWPRN